MVRELREEHTFIIRTSIPRDTLVMSPVMGVLGTDLILQILLPNVKDQHRSPAVRISVRAVYSVPRARSAKPCFFRLEGKIALSAVMLDQIR
jgi:hypothetical protein